MPLPMPSQADKRYSTDFMRNTLADGRVFRTLNIVVDNGPEFASKAVDQWAARGGVNLRFIDPGKPMQNAYIESVNGRLRAECLNQHWFETLPEARQEIESWRMDYNERRPHTSLRWLPPQEFKTAWQQARAG